MLFHKFEFLQCFPPHFELPFFSHSLMIDTQTQNIYEVDPYYVSYNSNFAFADSLWKRLSKLIDVCQGSKTNRDRGTQDFLSALRISRM